MSDKKDTPQRTAYAGAAGGWPALREVVRHLREQEVLMKGNKTLMRANQPQGFDCPGCAWPDPKEASSFEYCENGAKAVAAEATRKRATPELFAKYTVSEMLAAGEDYWLESHGRLTHPMRYDRGSDKYVECSWEEAFGIIGRHLRGLDDPNQAEFYTSGRTSNEAAFLYQLFVREFGTNNFPDCSNMCHEATSVGLPRAIGVGKGTVLLEDFDEADLIISVGHNPATNHPRMLRTLQEAATRGARIIVFNPLRERGLERYTDPQNPMQMIATTSTALATNYYQLRVGGDAAACKGLMKSLAEREAAAPGTVFDREFLDAHTTGLQTLLEDLEATSWEEIERLSGLSRVQLEEAAGFYAEAKAVILCYGMGVTQHVSATQNIYQLVNLLLRGNIGRPGAGICPLRGHSNVQGDRTVGISERPPEVLLDNIGKVCGFEPPREHGHTVTEALKAMHEGRSKVFIGLGGNVARAAHDLAYTAEAFSSCDLTVWILTKPNMSTLIHGKDALILPALGRTERDIQDGRVQSITVEDSMSMVHASVGMNVPASELCRSETWIVGEIAKATLPNSVINWDHLVADNDRIRDLIARIVPGFEDFNARLKTPGGFYLGNEARDRVWNTPEGKAVFRVFHDMQKAPAAPVEGQLTLTTARSHDQYNTTIYNLNDRYRGIINRRDVVFLNIDDMLDRGINSGDRVDLTTVCEEPGDYSLRNLEAVGFDLPRDCAMAYFPEANVLIPWSYFDPESFVASYKSVPVLLTQSQST
jgi:molybdopterin-dependent oxidoreductase alpha subunit